MFDERNIMNDAIRWGIIGTGSIAHLFARGLGVLDDARLVAVGSRTQASADKFADEFGVKHRHVGVEELVANEDVDVVYVATPHPMHKSNTLQCLDGGKPVLCEKPMAVSVEEAEDMVKVCREKKVTLQIGNMMRFNPCHTWAKQAVQEGKLGEVREARGKFGYHLTPVYSMWRVEPDLSGGGAIMDVGVHTLDLLRYILGREVKKVGGLINTGEYPFPIDVNSTMLLEFEDGIIGTVNASFDNQYRENNIEISGTEGSMLVGGTLRRGSTGKVTLGTAGGTEEYSTPEGYLDPYVCQIEDFRQEGRSVKQTISNNPLK